MIKEPKNKKITLDKLAQMMAKSFDEIKTELKTEFQQEMGGLKQEMGGLKQELSDFKTEVRERFNKVDDRLERIEDTHYEFTNNDAKTEREITGLKKRVTVLEQKVL